MSDRKDLSGLESNIDYTFDDIDFLTQAMVHRSYLNEHSDFHLGNNERLEFLGDAVLEVVVTEYLYRNYENPEGELTNWRAALVNSKMLARVADELNINDYLYLSKGESRDTGKARQYILANSVEAIIGAVYLDGGIEPASAFIHKNILTKLPDILKNELYLDPKSKFQEIAQEKVGITPSYRVLEESGPDHDKYFKVGVFLGEELIAEGKGSSKQEAQIDSAQVALDLKNWN